MYDLIDVKTQKKDRASIVKLYLKIYYYNSYYYSKLFNSFLMYMPRFVSCSLIPNFSRTSLLLL